MSAGKKNKNTTTKEKKVDNLGNGTLNEDLRTSKRSREVHISLALIFFDVIRL